MTPPRATRSWSLRPFQGLLGAGFLVALLIAWQLAKQAGYLNYKYLPRPWDIARAAQKLVSNGQLASNFGHTTLVTLEGWAIASVVGVGLGLALGLNNTLWRYSMASFDVLRALPPIAFVPAALLVAGFSSKAELVIVAYGAFLPTLVYTVAGVRSLTRLHWETAQALRLEPMTTLKSIVLPAASGSIIVGLRVGLGLSLSLAVVAEMIGNPAGVGNQLVFQQEALNTPNLFVYVLGLGVLGILLNFVLVAAIRLTMPALVSQRGGRG